MRTRCVNGEDARELAAADERVTVAEDWLPASGSGLRNRRGDPHGLASIVYTSGTTGHPKPQPAARQAAQDVAVGEQCDDGNLDDGDGCQSDCALPICGDGSVDASEVEVLGSFPGAVREDTYG